MGEEVKYNNILVYRYDSINDIDKYIWNLIIDDNHLINTYEHLKAVEYSGINNLKYKYYIFYFNEKPIGIAYTGIFTFGLDIFTTGILHNFFNSIKKIFPNFLQVTMIECGHPAALGAPFIAQEEFKAEIIKILDNELVKLARESKTTFILLRDFYLNEKRFLNKVLSKYKQIEILPNTFLKIAYNSFDEYLKSLTSKIRLRIKKRLKYFEENGGITEKIIDFSGLSNKLTELWNNNFLNAKDYSREVLNSEYFQYISDFLGEKSFILACKKDNKIIGFSLILDSGDRYVALYCGLDYAYQDLFTYFILYYKLIELGIQAGKKQIEFGVTSYHIKTEFGSVPVPIFGYVKSINPVLNKILSPFFSLISDNPEFIKRKTFNTKLLKKIDIREKLFVELNDNEYKVLSFDFNNQEMNNSFVIESKTKLTIRKKTCTIVFKPPFDYEFEVIAVLIDKKCNEDLFEYSFKIKKIINNYLPLYYAFLRNYELLN